jgi:FixJ family two-component response regulator
MISAHPQLKEEWIDVAPDRLHTEIVTRKESYFLTTIGSDLRQSLRMLSRMQHLLAIKVKDKDVINLIGRLNEVENFLENMMATLLERSQRESGISHEEREAESGSSTVGTKLRQSSAQIDANPTTIFVVGDQSPDHGAMLELFREKGWSVETYPNGEAFIKSYRHGGEGCLIFDARMQGMGGLEMQQYLEAVGGFLPTIMITGHADIRLAVRAIRAGAVGFLEQPVQSDELIANIEQALELARNANALSSFRAEAMSRMAGLTVRERQVMNLVVEGNPNKQIAYVLGINQRTVETHRASVMKKIGARSLPELIHLTIAGSPQAV